MKDDDQMITPLFQEKLTDAESDLIAKYFHQTSGNTWKPSLIAFPHFQTFPSRVHKVMHSFKTGLLIDAMQRLEGLSFGCDSKISLVEVKLQFIWLKILSLFYSGDFAQVIYLMDSGSSGHREGSGRWQC